MGADMNNPPAFPLHNHGAQTLGLHVTGMSLRDYMAAKAMTGLLTAEIVGEYSNEHVAEISYRIADAMLEARDGKD
jgi:hypothetical protein